MAKKWITITEAATLVGLTNSGFYNQFTEEKKRKKLGKNTIVWKLDGNQYWLDKQSVLEYFAGRRK